LIGNRDEPMRAGMPGVIQVMSISRVARLKQPKPRS
jgi:hypothetical protein